MTDHLPLAGEPNADYRARIARRQAEAAEIRQRELIEQTSTINPPDLRIRIWERLHEITMPLDSSHRLLRVIAAQTGLTMAEVQAEQHNRAHPVPATAVEPGPESPPDPFRGPLEAPRIPARPAPPGKGHATAKPGQLW